MFKRAAVACLAAFVASVSAAAQEKPYAFTIGGAVVGPLSDSADRLSTGFGFTAGATWYINEQIGLSGDYVWSALGGNDDWTGLVASRSVDVTPRIQFGTISIRLQAPPAKVRLYAVAGAGLYRRTVAMSTTGASDITVCDPWWFVCTARPVPVGSVNRTRASNDPGVNVGAGIIAGRFFAEIRYHFMWGPSFDTPDGAQTATGKFLPLTLGFVF